MKHKIFILLLLMSVFYQAATQNKKDSLNNTLNTYFKTVKWRNIGPFRGGRSVTATGVSGNQQTYYMGTTGGGLWKTDDAGINWRNISDGFFKTGSVGAVAVAESDPNVVYVGMGEHAVRGVMTHHGDGFYKSTDAGKTWKKMGLDLSQHIARIVIHPKDPNFILVAVQGALYSKSKERGIYKSTDGGNTWKNVLSVNEQTGCAELSMDMNNPRILYAAMWEHGRLPWQIKSGGIGSGLYKSVDGGDNWDKLENGLPKEMGKMAIAVCRSNPEKVYALIESDWEKDAGGLYVSHNAGKTWSQLNNDHRLIQRSWYYIEVFPDPINENTLYVLSAPALRSLDGGKTWEDFANTHGDYHDLWINPKDSKNMIIADDGGAAISFNFGNTWSSQNNMPTAQIYRINADNQFPYRIYGGQQDNTSISIAHRELGRRHITRSSWEASAGGESAFLAFDPDNPSYVLGGSYQGTIEVLDVKAKVTTNIMAAPNQYLGRNAKDIKYRFNWNAPIVWSKYEANTYYHGSQYVLKTTDMGKTWTEISPDLTRNEKEKQGRAGVPFTNEAVGAENYGTLAYIIESPYEKGVIWTGSDDGLVQLTTDGGKNWKNVTPNGLQECLINSIEVSPHDKGTAYIATTRYKFNDHTPAIYKTTDYGKTWVKITNGLPNNAFTRVVREDEARKDLLFAGTELGLFVSWNGGKMWEHFQLNLPITPITDIKIHKGDLIVATSGRSFWILDDLTLFRQYSVENKKAFSLYQPKPAYLANGSSELDKTDEDFTGTALTEGVNPANGVVIYYHLPTLKKDEFLTLEIKDEQGKLVRTFTSKKDNAFSKWDGGPNPDPTLPTAEGLNRFVWNMRYPTLVGVPNTYMEASFAGHKAMAGKYNLTLHLGNLKVVTTAEILSNPLYPNDLNTNKEYNILMSEMETEVSLMHQTINNMYAKRLQLEDLMKKIATDEALKSVATEGGNLLKKMKTWDEDMVQRQSKAYDDVENFPNKFSADYLFLINQAESDIPMITQPMLNRKKELDAQWSILKARATEILEKDIPTLNKKLWELGIGGIWQR